MFQQDVKPKGTCESLGHCRSTYFMLTRGCYTRSRRSVVSAGDGGVTAGQSALIKGGSKTNCNWVENSGEGHRVRPGTRFLKRNVRPPGGQGLLRILRVRHGFQEKTPHYRQGTERRQRQQSRQHPFFSPQPRTILKPSNTRKVSPTTKWISPTSLSKT